MRQVGYLPELRNDILEIPFLKCVTERRCRFTKITCRL